MIIAYGVRRLATYGRRVIAGMLAYASEVPELTIWVPGITPPMQRDKTIDAVVTQWTIRDEELTDGRIPILNVSSSGSPGVPQICCDNRAIAQRVFEHFRERNFRTLAYLLAPGMSISETRHAAFVEVCQENGHAPIIISSVKRKLRERQDPHLFDSFLSLPKPAGMMVADDETGHLVMRLCERLGIRIPDDLAIVGVNHDVDLTIHDPLPLSSVDINAERIGYEAARALVRVLHGETVPELLQLPPLELTVRTSSDVKITLDPNLDKALDYMYSHLAEEVELEDILRQQQLSRRALEMHFKAHFNEAPMKHLRSLRLEKVKFLLKSTDLSITEIGKRCGLSDNNYLSRLFRKLLKTTPSQYRAMVRPTMSS